ncbi:MAG: glycoside hydrolase family 3 C-terminal domain-containing protein [Oscillospiraceae bacterium]|nr:glycoside hydrolase family 3 C-terminal domain-containing protein [Oscillospiraceae bacterium]
MDFIRTKGGKVWLIVTAVLLVLVTVVNVLGLTVLWDMATLLFGSPRPIYDNSVAMMYLPSTNSKKEAYDNAARVNIEAAREGFVLLKNRGNALPVHKGARISIFGKNSVNMAFSGGGSGSFIVEEGSALYKRLSGLGIDISYKSIYDALEEDFKLNPTLKAFYENDKLSGEKRSNTNTDLDSGDDKAFSVGETPVSMYTQDVKNSYKDYKDLAIVVLTRIGGEGADLPRHQGSTAGAVSEDSHYLQLDQNEIDMLKEVTSAGFDKVLVLFNIPSAMEADFLFDTAKYPFADKIDAALWIGFTGKQGIMALPDILSGQVSPSGRTVDTWATDFLANPTAVNFGTGITQKPVSKNQTFDQYNSGLYYFVHYEEGVYVGYRYYETRGFTDGEEWYKKNVVFPFGYGLSYTTFDWTVGTPSTAAVTADGLISVDVTVRNTGSVAGKDVVQLYVSAPYTPGGIEKPHKVLCAFAKTGLLNPGQSETLTLTARPYDFASYDYRDQNKNGFAGYELDQGKYTFYVSRNAHESVGTFDCTAAQGIRFETDPVTGNIVGNRYTKDNAVTATDLSGVTDTDAPLDRILSRSDWDGTWPTAITDSDRAAISGILEELKNTQTNNPNNYDEDFEYPDMEEDPVRTVRDLLPDHTPEETYKAIVSYDDPGWKEILAAMDPAVCIDVYNHAAYQIKEIPQAGLPGTLHADGPSGFTCFLNSERISGTNQYCSEPVFASTWNLELIEEIGKAIGEEGIWGYDVTGQPYSCIYAPGVNIHRSPFGGRCSEYMSEDPFVTGMMAAAEIKGMQSRGVSPTLKHFVANEQETHRSITGDCTWLTEQSLREIYLKAFELAIKESQCRGIMTSFNRVGTMWTGGDYRLCTEILRNEWGFRGLIICDFNTVPQYMNGTQMAYAGGDVNLQTVGGGNFECDPSETGDAVVLLGAMKNIMYAMTNSNAMNGKVIGYATPSWVPIMYVIDGVIVLALAAWGILGMLAAKRNKKGREIVIRSDSE